MKEPRLFKNLYNLERSIVKSYEFNLDEYKHFLKQFDNPHKNIGNIIHIAGTNGKGSTAKILNDMLVNMGYNTGLYTSPHIKFINERITFNNIPISDYMFKKYEKHIYEKILSKKKAYRTFFEAVTTLAFLYFKDKRTDWVILETGLGGRLDSTNVVLPKASVLTKIDYDHTHLLGNSIEKITYEKCGIIKKNIPVYTFSQNKIVMDIIKKEAKKKNAELLITKTFRIKIKNKNRFLYNNEEYEINQPGGYQKINAALAVDVVKGLIGENDRIKKALKEFKIEGRMEILSKKPFVIADGSHNKSAIYEILSDLKQNFPLKKCVIISVFMADKDYKGCIDILKKFSNEIYLTTIPFFRAAKKDDYKGIKGIVYEKNLNAVFKKHIKKDNRMYVFIGSFYLIQYIRKYLN